MRILVTGGAGFIGSNFVRFWLERHPDDHVVVLDLLTYAGNRASLEDVEDGFVFVEGDIGDRDLAERWLDRADNGFTAHVTAPWRWQAHLLALWREGDEGLIGRPWDELALDALRGALDELESSYGADPGGWRWGRVHPLLFPHALGAANPLFGRIFNRRLEVGGGQETVAQVGWDPNDPFAAIWAPCWRMVADPAAPERSRWQAFTGQSGHVASPHYDDLLRPWLDGDLVRVPLTRPAAEAAAEERLVLEARERAADPRPLADGHAHSG
jgi:acyl-homoserine lactone acylase PvdQ